MQLAWRSANGSVPRALRRAVLALLVLALPAAGQGRVNQANWTLAERFSPDALRSLVNTQTVAPNWIEKTDSAWYYWKDAAGARFMLVQPKTRTKAPLFDHERVAAALSAEGGKPYDAKDLPFTRVTFRKDLQGIYFLVDSIRYEYDLRGQALTRMGPVPRDSLAILRGGGGRGGGGRGGAFGIGAGGPDFRNFSPDSTAFAFARDHNLFVVEVATGDTVQVSTDGVKDYSFGFRDTTQTQQQQDDEETQGQGGRGNRDPRVRANVTWSPDSRAFVVSRNDQRSVKELYLVDVLADPRPRLVSYKYAMPGEDSVAQQEIHTFRRGETAIRAVNVDKWKDQRLFSTDFPVGHDRLRMVRRDRLQRNLELIEVDLASGNITPLITESVENAFLEPRGPTYVKAGDDIIWYSERTGWAHFYLYDHNGRLKNPITSGEWNVASIVAVDSVRRALWFTGWGREPGENVYYTHLYRVNLDGSGLTLLNPGEAEHQSVPSDSRRYFIDSYSKIEETARSVVRDGATGSLVMELETFDTAPLVERGWKPPEQFRVKAADGVTDIYGNMWKPFDFDSTKSYPIIAHVYPGPQTESVSLTFSPTATQQELAQLGFIVIQIGNRGGNPRRNNAYHSFGYYNLRDYGLADKKAGIEQLAARHKWIDINRVGIYGHSGGGFMTAAALLLPPYNDFFKVGVSSAGNHDNNVYNQNWSEQHHGLREVAANAAENQGGRGGGRRGGAGGAAAGAGTAGGGQAAQQQSQDTTAKKFEIHIPTNAELAQNLKGNLLLVHGDMDNNVHPAGTIRLINELIKAKKRFDYMVMPGKAHGFADFQPYFQHMMYEYFAEHLLGDYYRGAAEIR